MKLCSMNAISMLFTKDFQHILSLYLLFIDIWQKAIKGD